MEIDSASDMPNESFFVEPATAYLKTLAHPGRLMILHHLSGGEHSVGHLGHLLGLRQAAISQMLARLRNDGLVSTRREGKTILYRLRDEETEKFLDLLRNRFGD